MSSSNEIPDIKGYFVTTTDISWNEISSKIKIVAKNYLYNEQESMNDIIKHFKQCTDKYLLAVFCVSNSKDEHEKEWICVKIIKKPLPLELPDCTTIEPIPLVDKKNLHDKIENLFKCNFDEASFEVSLNQPDNATNLIGALKKVMDLMSDEICLGKLELTFEQAVVEAGLCNENDARYKGTLEKVLLSLEVLLNLKQDFTLGPNHFINLCKKLNSANFKAKQGDLVDLRVETLKLIVQLKENGQLVDDQLIDNEFKKETGFLHGEKKIFLKQILDFDKQLRDDPRDTNARDCLQMVINDRIEYLSNKNKLVPDFVTAGDVFKVFEHFLVGQSINNLKSKKEALENQYRKIASDTKVENESKVNEAFNRGNKLQEIRHQLEYLEVKFSIRFDCNFHELIPILATKSFDTTYIQPNFLIKIFDSVKSFISISTVSNIFKFLLGIPKSMYNRIESRNIPENFYTHLTQDSERQLVCLTNSGFFGKKFPDMLLDFLTTTLIVNSDENMRKSALEALAKTKQSCLPDQVRAIILIEKTIHKVSNSKGFFRKVTKKMFNHVDKSYRLTWNCFEQLVKFDMTQKKMVIIETIIGRDLQNLPQFFVESIKNDILSILTSDDKLADLKNVMLNVFESMITGQYMKLSELKDVSMVGYLKDATYRKKALMIILTATRMGDPTSDIVVRTVKTITPRTELVMNCIRALTKVETPLDIVQNSRKPITERQSAINNLVQDVTFHDVYTLQILMNLVKFDHNIRDTAFPAFLEIISPETWKGCEDKFPEMIKSMKINDTQVPIHAMSIFVKKDLLTNTQPIIDYLIYRTFAGNLKVQKECISILKEVFKKGNSECEMWIDRLITILCTSRSKEIKLLILDLIDAAFNFEDFEESRKTKITSIRNVLFEKLDRNEFPAIFEMVRRQNYAVPESSIEEIIRSLPELDSTELNLVSDGLGLIHEEQKLKQETLSLLVSIVGKEVKFLENLQLITLLHEGISRNVVGGGSMELIKNLLEVLNCDNVKDDYEEELKHIAFKILRICLSRNENDLTGARPSLIINCRKFCFKTIPENKVLEVIQKKNALEILLTLDDSIFKDENFIHYYYDQLKVLLDIPARETSLVKLNNYMYSPSITNQIQVLHALTITGLYKHQVDTSIFFQKHQSEWQKELLCNILVRIILARSTERNELALDDFLNSLRNLEERLKNIDSAYQIETVLECLIENKCAVSFEDVSDVLCLLKNKDALTFFLSKNMEFDLKILKVKEIYIQECIPSLTAVELETLMKELLQHRMSTVTQLIGTTLEYDTVENIIRFFERVNLDLTRKNQETFLKNISSIKSVQGWHQALSKEIVEKLWHKKQKNIMKTVSEDDNRSLIHKLSLMLNSGWSLSFIEKFIDRLQLEQAENGVKHVLLAIDTIFEYKLKEIDKDIHGRALFEIINQSPVKNWDKMFHEIAVFQTFPGTSEKPLDQLIEEMVKTGKNISYLRNEQTIKEDYEKVMNAYQNISKLIDSERKICEWKTKEVKSWSLNAKTHYKSFDNNANLEEREPFIYEAVAVTIQAVKIINKFLPRDVQLLSLLCMLNTSSGKGRLAQINTGEGKTTIIAMLAVIKALQGHTVDIITSSTELAKPQSIQQEPFYSLFDISVSHNGEDQSDIKKRYKSTVLYGAALCFQGDILRDEYGKLGTRSGRKCDLAIVDEADSMLIDGKNHIVMLSSLMPAMNYLEPCLAAVNIQVKAVASKIFERDGKTYFIDEQNRIGDDGEINNEIEDIYIELNTTKVEFITRSTEIHIRKLLRDTEGLKSFPEHERKISENYPELQVPNHLYELVTRVQLKKWIDSAIYAIFKCELNKHYVLTEKGNIAPVDASNTGVIQQNMHWNNGLHQFLEIKHGAKITPENLTTNYISNVSFFQRYGANIFGLTGTLGSEDSINLLTKTYNVDSVIVPPFKQKQHHELSPIIVSNENDWYKNIIESSLQKLRHNRGVLIIARYIEEVDTIYNMMREAGCDSKKIKVYKTQRDSDSVHAELKAGEVIIATNIAGRGTDIKPSSKIEENGGLHVCLTFLPYNKRVEEQNVGRTSRTGNKGTSQFILLESSGRSLEKLRLLRNLNETDSLKCAETEIKRVSSKDAIFYDFCKFLNGFDHEHISPLEERFGIWLQINGDKFDTESKESLLSMFDETFKAEIRMDKNSNNLIRNICRHIIKANGLIKSKKYDEAFNEYSKAIEKDPNFAEVAYYSRAYCLIKKYGGDSIFIAQDKNRIEASREDLLAARKILNKRVLELQIIQNASDGFNLSEQVKNKMTLYNVQLDIIKQAIGPDLDEANAELTYLNEIREQIEEQINALSETAEQTARLDEVKKEIDDLQKKISEGGVIGTALRDNLHIRIEWLELEKTLPSDQDIQYYGEEIGEFRSNGMIGNFNISGLKPIPWGQVALMALIGFSQLALGAYLTVSTLGAGFNIGVSLMLEGVCDLILAVKDGIIDRNINWTTYAVYKSISLTASVALCGLSGIKDAALSVQSGAQIIAQGAITSTVERGLIKTGAKLFLENTIFQLATGIAKEIVISLATEGLKRKIMIHIEEYLVKKLQTNIYEALNGNTNVQRLLAIDLQNRNQYFQDLVCKEAMKILDSNNKKDGLNAAGIAKTFATRIAGAKIKNFGMVLQLINAGIAVEELINFEEKFLKRLNKSIDKIIQDERSRIENSESNSIALGENENMSTFETRTQRRNLETINQIDSGDIDTTQANQAQIHAAVQHGTASCSKMCTSISKQVSSAMTNTIMAKIAIPVVSVAANFGMDMVTAGVKKVIDEKTKTYRDHRATNFMLSGDVDGRVPAKIKEDRMNDPEFMKENEIRAKSIVNELAEGGEAGVLHMHALSENINQKITIYDKDGNVWNVINEHLSGESVHVQYHPAEKGKQTYWSLPDGEASQNNSGGNNCLFDCIAAQTGQTPAELRSNTVKTMQHNIVALTIVMPEIERVQKYKSEWHMYGKA